MSILRRFSKGLSQKTGLPPGYLIHIGDKKTDKTIIDLITYDEHTLSEVEHLNISELPQALQSPQTSWLNIVGLHDVSLITEICGQMGIHPLVQEDILNTDHRPKLEIHEDYLFFIIKMLSLDDSNEISVEQISLIVAENVVISFQEQSGDVFDAIRDRIRNPKRLIRKMGADYLAYCLLDMIVDNYFGILDNLSQRLEEIEDDLAIGTDSATMNTIHLLKRDTTYLKKVLRPLREVCGEFLRMESNLIKPQTEPYLKDLNDHALHIIDWLETYREALNGVLEIQLTVMSIRMNEIMKVLTIIATIFIPLTFIVGIYGMNFNYMPELEWRWGYFFVLGFMFILGMIMLLMFRKKKWL